MRKASAERPDAPAFSVDLSYGSDDPPPLAMSTPPVARSGRTLLASILFVDLVGFSRTTVTEQIEVKRALTLMLRKTLAVVPPADYRLMDTGDGAAIGFLADPEHALYFAL